MKIKTALIIGLLSLFFTHCSFFQGDDDDAPTQLISKDKMIIILADIQITEAYLMDLKKSGHKVKDTSLLYYKRVFKKNDVTKTTFEESLLYYKQDLKELENMYIKVITRLNELNAKSEEILLQMKADSIIQDSVQQAIKVFDSIQKLNDTSILIQ